MFNRANADIIVLTETHFKIRHKTPLNYILVSKSKTQYENRARGGVAVYVKHDSMFNIDIVSADFDDIVVFNIRGTNCIFAAAYLPPIESYLPYVF